MSDTNVLPVMEFVAIRENVIAPSYATTGAACADIHARLDEAVRIDPGKIALIPTGLSPKVPEGYELQIRPRSGMGVKRGILIPNSPGTVDSDFRGEIKVGLLNNTTNPVFIYDTDRIAQARLARAPQHEIVLHPYNPEEELTEHFTSTQRGSSGFGSTGR